MTITNYAPWLRMSGYQKAIFSKNWVLRVAENETNNTSEDKWIHTTKNKQTKKIEHKENWIQNK